MTDPQPTFAARIAFRMYKSVLSPVLHAFSPSQCLYLPTCSEYADGAIERFGLWAGGWMTLARLLRCHPLGTKGLDFVPETLPADSRWYMPWRYGRWRGTNAGPVTRLVEPDATRLRA